MPKKKIITIVIIVNLLIFILANLLFTIKYEQVDDFIIYNMYSGLDGTYNVHGIYMHPVLCFIVGLFFKIIPAINWHSIFLLAMQFLCFSLIGYKLIKKHQNAISIILYTVFASIFYTALLMLIQYTSVSALLILTSVFLLIDMLENKEERTIKYKVLIFMLFAIGIMLRMQSIIIIAPFMAIYLLFKLVQYLKNKEEKTLLIKTIKNYGIYISVILVIHLSSVIIYNSDSLYKNYMEYNDIRAELHDINYVSYNENKEIFDEIGWTENDHYLFYTFGFGDENKYSKENLKKILDYKIAKDGKYKLNTDIEEVTKSYFYEALNVHTYISIIFFIVFVIAILTAKNGNWKNVLIFITTVGMHVFFIVLGRSMQRVVIPEYIIGTALLMYNIKLNKTEKINDGIKNCVALVFTIVLLVYSSGLKYNYGYKIQEHKSIKDVIEYTNSYKENVYLYTVPSLQFRYLAYNVYQMPPKGAFSNLRVIGGWDMFTGNYYDFKERYNLDGTLLDLLKDNVYLIDGEVEWSGNYYDNYKCNILKAIYDNYGIKADCKEIKKFDNLTIYKLN